MRAMNISTTTNPSSTLPRYLPAERHPHAAKS